MLSNSVFINHSNCARLVRSRGSKSLSTILLKINLIELSVADVQKTSALNPSKIFRLKLLRANLIDHYKFDMPPLPFSFA